MSTSPAKSPPVSGVAASPAAKSGAPSDDRNRTGVKIKNQRTRHLLWGQHSVSNPVSPFQSRCLVIRKLSVHVLFHDEVSTQDGSCHSSGTKTIKWSCVFTTLEILPIELEISIPAYIAAGCNAFGDNALTGLQPIVD